MNRFALVSASLAVAMIMGCSSPSDQQTNETNGEDTGSTAAALHGIRCDVDPDPNCDCDGPGKKAITLLSFSSPPGGPALGISGTTLTGLNGLGQTITATFTATTNFRLANVSRYTPGEPILPAVLAYNAAVKSHGNVLLTLEDLLSFGGQARVSTRIVNGVNVIVAFRPVP